MFVYISLFLWMLIVLTLVVQYAPDCAELGFIARSMVLLVFIVGGPALAFAAILEAILSCLLPPGWGNDDDDDFKRFR